MTSTSQPVNSVQRDTPNGKAKHLYKIIVLGDYAVGKTAIIKRYTEGVFTPNYRLTIGVDFASKTLSYDDDKDVTLQIWDIAGHERFGTMTRVYYKFAIAGVLVFDLTREATFDAVLKWKEDVNNKVVLADNQNIPLLLLANKADMPDVAINKEMLDEFVKTHGFVGWFPVSAKEGTGINEAMRFLVETILKISIENAPRPAEETITVSHVEKPAEVKKDSPTDCC